MARYRIYMLDRLRDKPEGLSSLAKEIENLYLSGELPGKGDAINITKPENTNVEFGQPSIPGFNVRVFVDSIEHRYQIDSRGIPMEEIAIVYATWSMPRDMS